MSAPIYRIDSASFQANPYPVLREMLESGDVVRISMGDGSNSTASIDNQIQLYDQNGVEIGSIVAEVNAVLDVTLPSSGTYLILASDAGAEQTANYGLSLQRLNNPGAVTPIAFGETLTGSIGLRAEIDAYGFAAATVGVDSILSERQRVGQRDQIEGDEKENGRWQNLNELVPHRS